MFVLAFLYEPAVQVLHEPLSAGLTWPSGQGSGLAEPWGQYESAGHLEQLVDPVIELYCPALHGLHTLTPDCVE